MASSASSSSSSFMVKTYDVFVSFKGADILYTFLSHLQTAFNRYQIKAFVDEDLERGEEITSSLLAKIKDSYVSVVIFSENYASSAWCLDEMVKILECKNNMEQIVIPVFYGVDPTDVQEHGGNFGAAIFQHTNDFKDCLDKVKTWSHALKEIAQFSGLVSLPINLFAAMPSSSSFMAKTYDVFVSFRGADIRYTFLSHLQSAFDRNQIKAFVDEDLERGEEITSSLLAKIEDSYVSVVIFSENYAFSAWCLEELVKILECKNNMEQIVIPVFYGVDPTDVQELGGNFGAAIFQHTNDFKDCLDKVETWCHALKEIAQVSGLVSHPTKPDSKLIDGIINHTLEELLRMDHHSNSDDYKELVGIDYHIKYVESLFCVSSSKVHIVGIWGMGGIGKSTLAKKVYDRIKVQFPIHCFVENVRERFENGNFNSVQNEIFCAIFGPKVANKANYTMLSTDIVQGLRRRKVCIILDDVNNITQIEILIGKPDIFGHGSVVIITSRDKQLLKLVKAEIYEVEALDNSKALHLFCLHAFNQSTPKQDYAKLSEMAVNYAQGNPLALKVLGSNLYSKSVEEWGDELENLKGMPDETIEKVLRISYDRLKEKEKEIFLYIACFFKGQDKDCVVRMLDMDGSIIGIRSLCDKSLISMTENCLQIHDLLQQMGKDITCEENELGKRKILWHHEDIRDLLTNDEGSEAIKGISLDMSKSRDIELKPTTFGRLHNLRYLKFHDLSGKSKVYVLGGLTCLPPELRLLQWDGCPLKSLPSSSFLKNLVELRMRHSKLEELWSGTQQLGNLKLIDLSRSCMLSRLPDFSKAPKVEILNLRFCGNLQSLPENLGTLKSLLKLRLYNTAIIELPESICNVECLKSLELPRSIRNMPNNLGKLKSLKTFTAHDINMLEFPNILCSMVSLEKLYIGGNDFESIPETIKQLYNLKRLDLQKCKRLQYLPELPQLNDLELNGCTSLKSLFGSSQLLHKQEKLIHLGLGNCLNLNQEEHNQIIDSAIASYPYKDKRFLLIIPGSEVPQKIKNKNKSGSSLSLSFSYKQLELLRSFCFCLVFKPKPKDFSLLSFRCEAIFMDELGHKFHALKSCRSSLYSFLKSTDPEHLLLWHDSCSTQSEVEIGGPFTVHFNFSTVGGCDGIISCGVDPLFEDNNGDIIEEEDEEKLPVN